MSSTTSPEWTPITQPAPTPEPYSPLALVGMNWQQWVAENLLRHCTPASMVATMVGAGMDAQVCEAAIAEMQSDPVFLAAQRVQQLHHKLQDVAANVQRVWELDPDYAKVDKCPMPARQEFLARYVVGCRPVVITDIARDWPAMSRWSTNDLKQRFGHLEVEIQSERERDPRFEMNKLDHRRKVRLGNFVDQVLAGGKTNDYYMTANNEALRRPEFAPLLDDIGTLPSICDRSALAAKSSFWFGPAGTVTPLHHDTLMLFHTQVVGRKRWRFVSPLQTPRLYNHHNVFSEVDLDHPDPLRHPDFQGVTVLDVTVEPGETIFLPLGWWHQVESLDVSLSFSYSNLALPNHYTYRNPDIRDW